MNIYLLSGIVFIIVGIVLLVAGSLIGLPFIIFGILFQLKGRGIIQNIIYRPPLDTPFETRALRMSVALYWVLFSCAMMIYAFESAALPLQLTKLIDSQNEMISGWALSATIVFFVTYLIGSLGVFFLQAWARNAFTVGLAGMMIAAPFLGVMIVTPIFGSLEYMMSALNGISLYLIYFSQASEYFNTDVTSEDS